MNDRKRIKNGFIFRILWGKNWRDKKKEGKVNEKPKKI